MQRVPIVPENYLASASGVNALSFPQNEARAPTLTSRATARPRRQLTSSPWDSSAGYSSRKGDGCSIQTTFLFCRNNDGTGRRLT